jgi:fructan beta-fructosidase
MKVCLKLFACSCFSLLALMSCREAPKQAAVEPEMKLPGFREAYRPQYHFTPEAHWMNDPNGLVYNKGIYHLFYQYYPDDIVWGPMHWGHATSKDLVFWEHKPIALFPDEHGYIFSGSAVVDTGNTSGFGTKDNPPLVAVFTYHDINLEREGRTDYQSQGIAYSPDNGETWIKYEQNPVIPNTEEIKDFRDPKVFWHADTNSWILVLVAGDHARLYRSTNLKQWEFMSSFGKGQGAHGGVWECPDLFPLKVNGNGPEKWVLIISINPGAPNGGSGTQYFVGDFDGTTFSSKQQEPNWIDWGRDNYAGVTYNNLAEDNRVFIGWMSNWDYAMTTPTETWRSAMTLPRELRLLKLEENYFLANYPLEDLGTVFKPEVARNMEVEAGQDEVLTFSNFNQSEVRFTTAARDFNLKFLNMAGDTLSLSMDGNNQRFVLDRRASGETDFDPKFAPSVQQVPTGNLPQGEVEFRILLDWSSVELFVNRGQYALTAQIFPLEPYSKLIIENTGAEKMLLNGLNISLAESIWGYTPE